VRLDMCHWDEGLMVERQSRRAAKPAVTPWHLVSNIYMVARVI
jgi:hypothetical protein